MKDWLRVTSVALGVTALVACGTNDQTAGIDRGGVATPVAVVGPITGFGSIVVNGVHYAVDRASVEVDGNLGTTTDLALGQVVTVVGERDADGLTGTADTVSYQTNVRGEIAAVDPVASTITVLGQRVIARSSTVFDLGKRPAAFSSLEVGDFVAVSGSVTARGSILATRIETARGNSGLLVLGRVSGLDTAALRFDLGALVVDYSQAALIEGFASGGPSNGDTVVVTGTDVAPSGALLARELRRAPDFVIPAGSGAEIEGLITRFVSPSDFDVARRPVTTDAATQYVGGDAGALALDARVEVHGTVDANGVIVARRIEIEGGGFDE